MLGWRGRVGYLSTDLEKRGPCEFYKVVPDGVAFISANVTKRKEGDTKNLENAAKALAGVGVDCIIYACTGRVVRGTHGSEEDLIKLIEDVSGKPATTTINAAYEAMKHLSMKRILLSGHGEQKSTNQLKDYFEKKGIQVPYTGSVENRANLKRDVKATYGISNPSNIHFPDDLCYTQTMAAFRKLPSHDAVDGIYIPCASWSTHKYLNLVEQDSGIPVVSTHRSNVWWAFKTIGIKEPIHGFGKLLESI